MNRCLVWGIGKTFLEHFNLLKYYEQRGDFIITAVTGNETLDLFYGFRFVEKKNVIASEYDLVLVASTKFKEITREAIEIGFIDNIIIPIHVLGFPNLDLEKYLKIKEERPTIFSMNCWGGILYHRLGLEFQSPFINMFLCDTDFLKFLNNAEHYIEQKLVLNEYRFNIELGIQYPVCLCDDIRLFFNHYKSFDEANECWNRRKKRINWNNILVVMYSSNEEVMKKFKEVPYEKKICFTPIRTNYSNCEYLESKGIDQKYFYKIVSQSAWGYFQNVNLLELLLRDGE